jgi:hypothetical protein
MFNFKYSVDRRDASDPGRSYRSGLVNFVDLQKKTLEIDIFFFIKRF